MYVEFIYPTPPPQPLKPSWSNYNDLSYACWPKGMAAEPAGRVASLSKRCNERKWTKTIHQVCLARKVLKYSIFPFFGHACWLLSLTCNGKELLVLSHVQCSGPFSTWLIVVVKKKPNNNALQCFAHSSNWVLRTKSSKRSDRRSEEKMQHT